MTSFNKGVLEQNSPLIVWVCFRVHIDYFVVEKNVFPISVYNLNLDYISFEQFLFSEPFFYLVWKVLRSCYFGEVITGREARGQDILMLSL